MSDRLAVGTSAWEAKACPIAASLGLLGKKWTLAILRDIVLFERTRFSTILHNNEGMSARILSIRLGELSDDGLIRRIEDPENPRHVRYVPTAKGQDSLPILLELLRYGVRHHADIVFTDGRPRELEEVLPERLAKRQQELIRLAEGG